MATRKQRTRRADRPEDADLVEQPDSPWLEGDDSRGWDDGDEADNGVIVLDEDEPARPRRAPRITDADRLEAFRAGRRSYEAGQGKHDWPKGLQAELAEDWSAGWRCARAEALQGEGVAVYSPFDPSLRDIAALEACYRRYNRPWPRPGEKALGRDDYPTLPWTMQALREAQLRNIHTGSLVQLSNRVQADGWGNPHLVEDRPWVGWNDERRPYLSSVGIWWSYGRYLLEHWVRVDHWVPAEQLPWFAKQIAYHRDQIARHRAEAEEIQQHPERHSCASSNYQLRLREIAHQQAQLREALSQLRAFAEAHGLAVTPELINGAGFRSQWHQTRRRSVEQMQLL
jgi:hypothetical protein